MGKQIGGLMGTNGTPSSTHALKLLNEFLFQASETPQIPRPKIVDYRHVSSVAFRNKYVLPNERQTAPSLDVVAVQSVDELVESSMALIEVPTAQREAVKQAQMQFATIGWYGSRHGWSEAARALEYLDPGLRSVLANSLADVYLPRFSLFMKNLDLATISRYCDRKYRSKLLANLSAARRKKLDPRDCWNDAEQLRALARSNSTSDSAFRGLGTTNPDSGSLKNHCLILMSNLRSCWEEAEISDFRNPDSGFDLVDAYAIAMCLPYMTERDATRFTKLAVAEVEKSNGGGSHSVMVDCIKIAAESYVKMTLTELAHGKVPRKPKASSKRDLTTVRATHLQNLLNQVVMEVFADVVANEPQVRTLASDTSAQLSSAGKLTPNQRQALIAIDHTLGHATRRTM